MLNTSYNLSFRLKECLEKIELKRREIRLTPISPKKPQQLKWFTMIDRIYSCKLDGNSLKLEEIVRLISGQRKKRLKTLGLLSSFCVW